MGVRRVRTGQEVAFCRRCGVRLTSGGIAGYCTDCARELVAHIKKVMPAETARVTPVRPRRASESRRAGGLLYTTRERCPVCGNTFDATRVAMSRLRVEAREPDFYVRYSPLDPNQYQVWICPACGYAAPQGAFSPLLPDERERAAAAGLRLREQGEALLQDLLPIPCGAPGAEPSGPGAESRAGAAESAREGAEEECGGEQPVGRGPAGGTGDGLERPVPAGGAGDGLERPLPEVVSDYARALYFARFRRRPHGIAAGLYLRLAWVHRARGDAEADRRLSALALEEYLKAYEGEDGLPGNMDEHTAAYLIGVLGMRNGRLEEAVRYLGQVVNARTAVEPAVRKMAQDQWYELQQLWQQRQGQPRDAAADMRERRPRGR